MASFFKTTIPGCFRFQISPQFKDERGVFSKPLHLDHLIRNGIEFVCRESFISFSKKDVMRGMHFQIAPYAHDKIVSCLEGEIFDVVLDLRADSPTFGKAESFKLTGESGEALFVPVGCAHGFQVVSQQGAWVAYYTSKEHHAESDRGIHWQSVPIQWPVVQPIVSGRDSGFPAFDEKMDRKKYFS